MEFQERSSHLFERLAAYPQPPLIPLPAADDLSSLAEMGLQLNGFSRLVVKAAMAVTGFSRFRRELAPELETRLRETDFRGSYLFAPVIAATLALADDPRSLSPAERAVTLLAGARDLHRELIAGRLRPDESGGKPLEMDQYPNLFSTCVIPDAPAPRLFKSTATDYVTVIVGGRYYRMQISEAGVEASAEQLLAALTALIEQARTSSPGAGELTAGHLTAAQHPTQCRIFPQLQQHSVNRDTMLALRHSFLTICLDLDHHPATHAAALRLAQIGNPGNRWYHASLQLVVFGNARASAVCNFSAGLDGNTMMRGGAEIQRRAAALTIHRDSTTQHVPLPVTELQWQISPELLTQAQAEIQAVLDEQPSTFELPGTGRDAFGTAGLNPVPTFILALALATKRLTGQVARVTQFLAMTRYRCMDVNTAMVTTPEVIRFVRALDDDHADRAQLQLLLHEAISSQAQKCRQVRRAISLDDLFTLYLHSLKRGPRRFSTIVIAALTLRVLRLVGLHKPMPREILVSHPEIYPEVPLVGRPGIRLHYVKLFGLHYQMMNDRTVITMMPGLNWPVSNQQFIAELERCLKELQAISETTGAAQAAPATAQS